MREVDRSLAFSTERLGVDYGPSPDFRVVQLTPPGSACSVQIGVGLTDAEPGSVQGLYLVVRALEAARAEPAERGVPVAEIRHKAPLDTWQGCFEPGVDPERRDYASFAEFSDLTATCGRCRSAVFVPREVGAASSGLLASLTFRSFPLSDPAVRTGAFAADHQESCMAILRALECLVAWVDEGSVTKAAGVLHGGRDFARALVR
ncbi:hypothetical protein [Streptomyces olivaceoviridis]|uniref:hypothetical protein n=1 Tax=Streptomyces olivaceoviridis TaxID=1921 RepID=UPI0036AA40A6